MCGQFSRTELLLGPRAMERLARARVAIFGIGGVGGSAAEALARSGIGAIEIFDDDRVCLSNLNRQVIATHSALGQYKVDAMRARLLDINPALELNCHKMFYLPERADEVEFSRFDYVIDAVDTVAAKLDIVCRCQAANVAVISAMGAGNKLDPTAFRVADIADTRVCPLARVMRQELKKRGVLHLKVVYSEEPPMKPRVSDEKEQPDGGARDPAVRRTTPGSVAFVPPVVGFILAGAVVRELAGPAQA